MLLTQAEEESLTAAELAARLTALYCGPTSLECSGMEGEEELEWLHTEYERGQVGKLYTDVKLDSEGRRLPWNPR